MWSCSTHPRRRSVSKSLASSTLRFQWTRSASLRASRIPRMSSGSIEGVTSFVPARVARQQADTPPPPDGSRIDRFQGAVLIADISGFTMLAEALGRRGAVGAEDLTGYLNVYFGRLIELIIEHGGDILKF